MVRKLAEPFRESEDRLRASLEYRLRRAWRILLRNRLTLVGAIVLAIAFLVALFGSYFVPPDYNEVRAAAKLLRPGAAHWLGTDQFGRDVLHRVIIGSQASLQVGVLATLVAAVGGTIIGTVAGWVGGRVSDVLMRIMDVILAFPAIIMAIALSAVFGPGLDKVILIIAVNRIPQFARLVRGAVLAVREIDFMEAARALGARPSTIILKHLLPNCITPITVFASFSMATAINTEAALSFLGFGIQPPQPSWGSILNDARQYMLLAPWLAVAPGLAITLTVLGANLVGDGVRDIMDPRLKGG